MIIIRHTHAAGTIIEGSTKGDGVYEIVRRPANGGFTWRPTPGIFIRGSRDHNAQQHRIDAAATALCAAGHQVAVEIDNTVRPTAVREADLAERAGDRADRLRDRADRATARGAAREAAARRVLDHIPPGQPMLVDHHSYPADRRRRERAWANQDQARQEFHRADELTRRADAAETTPVFRHNPRVITRRIERLEAELRRRQRQPPRDDRTAAIDRLTEEISYWRQQLEQLAASGQFVPWEAAYFRPGDQVKVDGQWCTVLRVNRKSVSVPWIVGTMSGVESTHTDTVPYDKIYGRRRNGMQLDAPNGQPWPVALAKQVARWHDLLARAERSRGWDADAFRLRTAVAHAQRTVHDLPTDATDEQLAEAQDKTRAEGVDAVSRLACAYLAEYTRLTTDRN